MNKIVNDGEESTYVVDTAPPGWPGTAANSDLFGSTEMPQKLLS